jgi:hypothetical protein
LPFLLLILETERFRTQTHRPRRETKRFCETRARSPVGVAEPSPIELEEPISSEIWRFSDSEIEETRSVRPRDPILLFTHSNRTYSTGFSATAITAMERCSKGFSEYWPTHFQPRNRRCLWDRTVLMVFSVWISVYLASR